NLTTSSADVTLGIAHSAATLSGTPTRAAVAGVAGFDDLSIAKAGTGYVLTVSSPGLAPADSAAFDVIPGPVDAAHTVLSASPSTINADGTSGTSAVTV